MIITIFRHAVTSWNQQGRVQGHTDIDLLAKSEDELRKTRIHSDYQEALWYSSPLRRTAKTAQLISRKNAKEIIHDPLLIEMSWGDYEGLTRHEIKQKMLSQSDLPKLKRKAPNGESPIACCQRLQSWLNQVNQTNNDHIVAVTHKGMIRCALSLACDWDMEEDFPIKLKWHLPHIFKLNPDNSLTLLQANYDWSLSIQDLVKPNIMRKAN